MNIKLYWVAVAAVVFSWVGVAQAGILSVSSQEVPQAVVPNVVTNDILINFDTVLRGQQMILDLTAGSIFQDAFGSNTAPGTTLVTFFPTLGFDTFVTIGGPTAETSQPVLVVGGAVDLQAGSALQFNAAGLNIAWAPGTGVNILNGTDFITSRISLSNDAQGSFRYFGSTGETGNIPLVVEGLVVDGTIQFGVIPEPASLSLIGLALVGLVGFARRRS